MNGALAHYYRYLARDEDAELKNAPELPYDAGWQLRRAGGLPQRRLDDPRLPEALRVAPGTRQPALHRVPVRPDSKRPPGGLPSATDECSSNPDLSSRCGCATCHESHRARHHALGPMGGGRRLRLPARTSTPSATAARTARRAAARTSVKTFYITRELETTPGSVESELGKFKVLGWRTDPEVAALDVGPSALVTRPEYQGQLASCAVRNFAEYAFGRELSADEQTGWLTERTSSFASGGHDFLQMVKEVLTDDRYRRIE